MKNYRQNLKSQSGVALFMSLIALLAVSLMAAALVRTIGANNAVVGNIAFRQAAVSSGDLALENALNWIQENPQALNNDSAGDGYYATYDSLDFRSSELWQDGYSKLIPGTDANGNSVRYVVERMCSNKVNTPSGDDGSPKLNTCVFGTPPADINSALVKSATEAGGIPVSVSSPIFRVTAMVTGAKDASSFVQAFVY